MALALANAAFLPGLGPIIGTAFKWPRIGG